MGASSSWLRVFKDPDKFGVYLKRAPMPDNEEIEEKTFLPGARFSLPIRHPSVARIRPVGRDARPSAGRTSARYDGRAS